MTAMGCTEFSDVAAELALGSLTGIDRARALEHLDRCEACGRAVAELSVAADRLVELAPAVEPPLGFENRVLARLAPAPVRRPSGAAGRLAGRLRGGWRTWAPVAAAAAVLSGAATWAVTDAVRPGAGPAVASRLVSAELVAAGHPVGQVFAYGGTHRWVYMSVDLAHAGPGTATGATRGGWVTCELRTADGASVRLGRFSMKAGYGYWGAPVTGTTGRITGARLLGPGGTVLATATFPTPS